MVFSLRKMPLPSKISYTKKPATTAALRRYSFALHNLGDNVSPQPGLNRAEIRRRRAVKAFLLACVVSVIYWSWSASAHPLGVSDPAGDETYTKELTKNTINMAKLLSGKKKVIAIGAIAFVLILTGRYYLLKEVAEEQPGPVVSPPSSIPVCRCNQEPICICKSMDGDSLHSFNPKVFIASCTLAAAIPASIASIAVCGPCPIVCAPVVFTFIHLSSRILFVPLDGGSSGQTVNM